jgi:hypothetical protein
VTVTTHGHHIPGTTLEDEKITFEPFVCGGPGNCIPCTEEELKAFDTKGEHE